MKNLLERAGYIYEPQSGIWASPGFKGIAYSDGDEVEQRLARIIAETTDLRVLSDELRQHITDWPSLYHLSSSRANILRPFEQRLPGAEVLEIGAGCGAITRYLGESGAQVLALEGSARRAAIARARARDLPLVEVLAERFDQFRFNSQFDIVTLIGVLEYANQFVSGLDPVLTMLQRARSLVKPGGILIIAIENQLGVKYWAGAPEDHLGVPMYGIEGRYRADQPQTYGRKHLAELLAAAGFARAEFLSALPDYKLPVSILAPSGLESADFDAAALASESVRRDPQMPIQLAFSPELVWPVVMRNGLGADLANSFLIAASVADTSAIDPHVLAYHYSTERRMGYCKQTVFRRSADGAIGAHCNLLNQMDNVVQGASLIMRVPPHTPYVHGHTLASEFVHLVTRDGWVLDSVGAFVRRYLDIVGSLVYEGLPFISPQSLQTVLPGKCFDLVPQNIICDSQGKYHAIDLEWTLVRDMPVGWLLFRAMLLLVQCVTRFGVSSELGAVTRRGFFMAVLKNAGFEVDEYTLESFAAMEAAAQAEATQHPMGQLLDWWADSLLHTEPGINGNVGAQAFEDKLRKSEWRLQESEAKLQKSESLLLESERSLQLAAEHLRELVAQRDEQLTALQGSLYDMRASKSWKITAPLRKIPNAIAGLERQTELLRDAIKIGGGLLPTLRTTVKVLRNEGFNGIRWRMSNVQVLRRGAAPLELAAPVMPSTTLHLTPYYPNPLWDQEPPVESNGLGRFAVHCHFDEQSDVEQSMYLLSAIPFPFDLYVSMAGDQGRRAQTQARWKNALPRAERIQIEHLPASAQPLTSMVACFGQLLTEYPSFAHFAFGLSNATDAAQSLLGPKDSSGGRLERLLALMNDAAALVLGAESASDHASGSFPADAAWTKRVAQVCGLSADKSAMQCSVNGAAAFLMRGAGLRAVLPVVSLLDLDDHGVECEHRMSDALASLLPVFAALQPGRVLQIQQGDSTHDFRQYEVQHDYSASILHRDVRVLSYYLPQFHPTPENDEWHGKGFTEWTKVRAANPLFEGHYQQHIPHPDIGYYLLDSPEILRTQAMQMQKAGVHGQVFYHYWFSGRLILEKPAQMLLAHADIEMPFCFCWANENWTRRWDGNEREILLGQTYSADDARAFIRYLIPFFRDPRYIRVGTRPMLMVYRPSSIPDPTEYLRIWTEECVQAGIDAPYVVAVLTRGATDPADFQMDAGVERPLHDWTDGAVPDLRPSLQAHWPMNGSVLSYDQVRDYYVAQNDRKSFDYFRSNVPMWDNTARYGTGALLLHGSTPQSFQQWMEHSIADAQANLPADRRFVVVNAWNEWAEGAHLEPDTRYGYSYLNSVGRALAGLPYAHELNATAPLPQGLCLQVQFSRELVEQLKADALVRRRFFHCLAQSRILRSQGFCVDYPHENELPIPRAAAGSSACDFRVEFRRAVHFAPDAIERMLQTALATRASVIGNDYGRSPSSLHLMPNGAASRRDASEASVLILSSHGVASAHGIYRMRTDAWCFALPPHSAGQGELPTVTTIVRFHKGGRLEELRCALSCMYVMQDCVVVPLIAAQDLDEQQTAALMCMLEEFDWRPGPGPRVDHYVSPNGRGDLRSRMLNESLRKVSTRYAAFLDYDDLLFSDAYALLLQRMRMTGKAVVFGRVYWTDYRANARVLLKRRRTFEYGGSHEEFVRHNHAPLHSFLLNVEKIDRKKIIFFDEQRFMEDYLLTLQIFTKENADWEGLKENIYLGDYVHSLDREHTLALSNDEVRAALLSDPEYLMCEEYIQRIRMNIASHVES
ncbi:Methyltransferase type 12 [Acidovorax delafieldii 2AN]|uniref:Methyltransferase type 12 n=1 Tax=Acidovorax delafieldii 2AN TaxID=573060 RepID=C5T0P0_ACIDE|nr:glycoside hydrolase family 99-like domain-containing protein [Acidovorax delafieldii]EER61945.1 Methyltransferase type 12 [Acidovorax delafieldii 2AN]